MADFGKVLTSFRSALTNFPGNAELLQELLTYSEGCLQNSQPQQAVEILEIGLQKVGDSPAISQIQALLNFSYNWLGARRFAGMNDFGNALLLLERDASLAQRFSKALEPDLSSWFKKAEEIATGNMNSLDKSVLLTAKEDFLSAEEYYRNAGDLESADRAQASAQKITERLVHIDEIINLHNQINDQLQTIERFRIFMPSEMLVPMLDLAVRSLSLAQSYWPDQPTTLDLIAKSRMLAPSVGWDEKQVDLRLHPPVEAQTTNTKLPALLPVKSAPQNNQLNLAQKVEDLSKQMNESELRWLGQFRKIADSIEKIESALRNWLGLSLIGGAGAILLAFLFLSFWLIPVPRPSLSFGATALPTTSGALIDTETPTATATPTAVAPIDTEIPTFAATPTVGAPIDTETPTTTATPATVAEIKITGENYCSLFKYPDDTTEVVLGSTSKDITSLTILSFTATTKGTWLEIKGTFNGNSVQGFVRSKCVVDALGTPVPTKDVPTITPTPTP